MAFRGGSGEGVRVGARVCHGQEERFGVLKLEVLIRELITVDGAATGALLVAGQYALSGLQGGLLDSRCPL
jgi:hypothetical protein